MEKHRIEINDHPDFSRLADLTQSFSNFNELIEKLNNSYQHLEERFGSLNNRLEETNYKLRLALIENQKVRSFLHDLTESVPSGIVVYDLDGNVTMLNRAATELLEVDLENAKQEGIRFAFDSHPQYSALATIESGTPILCEEKNITLLSGKQLIVSFSSALLYDEDRNVIGALGLYHDISKIRKLEDEITRVRALAALGEMAATIAHEVRNPLGGILGFAALLRKDLGDDDPRTKTVDKIIKGVENLDRSVSSLLAYAQEVQPAVREVKIKPFLDEIVADFGMNLARNRESADIDLLISPESLEWRFDPLHIRQCLLNLLLNAHQAQQSPSEIKLSAIADSKLSLIISDSGCGIDENTRQRLFTPFFTTRKAGTGLGLATVKKLVMLHKGEVNVDSEVGRGTRITMKIPANL